MIAPIKTQNPFSFSVPEKTMAVRIALNPNKPTYTNSADWPNTCDNKVAQSDAINPYRAAIGVLI